LNKVCIYFCFIPDNWMYLVSMVYNCLSMLSLLRIESDLLRELNWWEIINNFWTKKSQSSIHSLTLYYNLNYFLYFILFCHFIIFSCNKLLKLSKENYFYLLKKWLETFTPLNLALWANIIILKKMLTFFS